MKRTLIKDTVSSVGKKVAISGWVNSVRSHGKLAFADIRDRSGMIQVVGGKELAKLNPEFVVRMEGLVKKREEKYFNPKIATGEIELEVEKVLVLAEAKNLPFDIHQPNLDVSLPVLLDYRAASLRNKKISDIFRVQATIVKTFRKHMNDNGFIEFQAPTIVATATEGGSQVFQVNYFDYKAYLAQSPQFYKQIMVSVFERVFTLAHAYRAEPSVTTRHMTEYIGMDVELGFINSWLDVVDTADKLVKAVFAEVKKEHSDILANFGTTIPKTAEKTPIVKLSEVQEIIFKRTGRDIRGEPDMDPEGEREICRWAEEKHGSEIVFISHYPTKKRPWYTYQDPENPEETLSFDLVGRGVEWITGGQRINDFEVLSANIKKMGGEPKDFEIPYLQAFCYGMPPEGGFCLGLERVTQNILGLSNIREATLYPRDLERVDARLSVIGQKIAGKNKNLFHELIDLLVENSINYRLCNHRAVYTSKEAAEARGTKLSQGTKALIMMADSKPILAVISAAKEVDIEKLKKLLAAKKLKMATAFEVEEISGVKIGAVPPFGSLIGLKIWVDKSLEKNEEIAFNAGLHTKSIIIAYRDWFNLVKPEKADFSL
ncbi:MAG: aspartate--tRNA(Asn) ligase [Patescibacteria group bacterium]|nr:aspartate--tRNA(Asn) ligase [Patescibacteria group bacterium]